MSKAFIGGIAALLVVIAGVVLAPTIWGQARGRDQGARVTQLPLQGPGSEIGVGVRELRSEELSTARLAGGVMIDTVRPDSPAARAGFRSGDIVTEIDGEQVRGVRHFARLVLETPPGRTVTAGVIRGGTRETITVTPQAGDTVTIDLPDISRQVERGLRMLPRDFDFDFDLPEERVGVFGGNQLGMSLRPLTGQLATYFGVEGGVLVAAISDGSAAERAGIRAGDVITAVAGQPIDSIAAVNAALRNAPPGSSVDVTLTREKSERTVRATIPDRRATVPAVPQI